MRENTPEIKDLYVSMVRIRLVEEKIAELYREQEMRCPVHLSIGQEATAVGVCSALRQQDHVFSGHRSHAHYLAKGGDLSAMIAEIYGKESGCCGGKGGSMHLTDLAAGFVACTPIVGSTIPIAVGAALASVQKKEDRVVVIFLGDGAMETGVMQESLNFASLKKLPVIFACENNLYSVYSPLGVRQPDNRSIVGIAIAHGLSAISVESGNDVLEVSNAAYDAVEHCRSGKGPVFLEMPTYRWREHCGPDFDNHIGYRSEKEFLEWKRNDPLEVTERLVGIDNLPFDIDNLNSEIENAFSSAKDGSFPKTINSSDVVYA